MRSVKRVSGIRHSYPDVSVIRIERAQLCLLGLRTLLYNPSAFAVQEG